ncbi:MAG: DUF4440 domain-containing protein [Cyanobacteria bacterium P01_D01_bin.116]
MKLIDILIKKENQLLLPEIRHSTTKLKELLSENFIEIGSSGKKFRLKEVLENLSKEKDWSAKISNIEFRMINEDVAQLFYNCVIYHNLDDKGSYSIRNLIWTNESDTWKMIFHQGTKISPL